MMLKQDWKTVPHVFVYGTLKQGYGNNRLLQDSEFVSEGVILGGGKLIGNGIPFFVPDYLCEEGEVGDIKGEIWRMSGRITLGRLDTLEGHPHGYYRSLAHVNPETNTASSILCWVYCWSRTSYLGQSSSNITRINNTYEWGRN